MQGTETPAPAIGAGEVQAGEYFDPRSTTCGLADAIAALPVQGGRVHLPAGTYVLRRSVYLPAGVSLAGEGAATVLAIRPLDEVLLERDCRRGGRSFVCRTRPPFGVGDEVGLVDEKMRGWWGTHGIVEKIEGRRVHLNVPCNRQLKVKRRAKAVNLFPAIWSHGEDDIEIRDLTVQGPADYNGPWWDFTFSGIHLHNCRRVRVLNCTVYRWPSDGIGAQGGSDVQVAQCQAHDCRGHGFHPGTNLGHSIWSHNIGRGNGGDGLFFCARVHRSICSDSVFSGNGLNGIGGVANGGDHHNIVSANVCADNARCGIDANRGEEQIITGNLLLNNSQSDPGTWPGICLHDLERSIVQGNRCADDQETPTQQRGIVESGDSDCNLVGGNLCVGMREAVTIVGRHSRAEGNLV
jgi:hypothetical protein